MALKFRVFALVAVLVLMAWMFTGTQAQVTFSRDWNPGKRTENTDLHNTLKTASAVCHLLMNQVRQLASCDNNNELEPGATIFSGRR
ncbi:AKH/corazonin-related peptide preproprotein [Tribolium castaneum]|uniref:ACP preprohormone n=1 Tax=Tribolium castaneum TaxID=7070 RepID=D5HKL7_TRICA|nr:AKH/corazonin-related peptide preproprotein [Tribolium castaneum]ADF28807.1 ACP preprohormone [Tribolium castaneum]|eukprot:NP_001159497.2 AKH/corazonin-related peptide preproprotein [Tribolium castaneum]